MDSETKDLFSSDADPTDPDAAPGSGSRSDTQARTASDPLRRETGDPYNLKDVTVPPGLRAQILEYAKEQKPQEFPEDTFPPNKVAPTAAPAGFVAEPAAEASAGGALPPRTTRSPERRRVSLGSLLAASGVLGILAALILMARSNDQAPRTKPAAPVAREFVPPSNAGYSAQTVSTPPGVQATTGREGEDSSPASTAGPPRLEERPPQKRLSSSEPRPRASSREKPEPHVPPSAKPSVLDDGPIFPSKWRKQ